MSNLTKVIRTQQDKIVELQAQLSKYREALQSMQGRYNKIQDIMEKHGLKYDNANDPMQKLFFTTYTELCEMEEIAKTALEGGKDE